MRKILVFVFVLLTVTGFTQTVKLSGRTANAEGITLSIFMYSDLISKELSYIAKTDIKSDNTFSISFEVRETGSFLIDIAGYQAGIFLQPGKQYVIEVDSLNLSKPVVYFSLANARQFSYHFVNPDKKDINSRMDEFYLLFDTYIISNFSTVAGRRNVANYDSLVLLINRQFAGDTSPYFKALIDYSLAHLEFSLRLNRDERIFAKWIRYKPVLLRHPTYMEFFNEFFDGFILARGRGVTLNDLKYTIGEIHSYMALTDSLGKDTALKNQYLRDLVLIKNMSSLINHSDFKNADVIEILRQASEQSPYPENRGIAKNLLKKLTSLNPGAPAPEFSLSGIKGETIQLKDFKGKYVLLAFVNSTHQASLQELLIAQPWPLRYRRNLQLISVHIDEFPVHTQDFVSQFKPEWIVAKALVNEPIITDYRLMVLPYFVLIDPAGYILKCPAKKPSEDFEGYFKRLLNIR